MVSKFHRPNLKSLKGTLILILDCEALIIFVIWITSLDIEMKICRNEGAKQLNVTRLSTIYFILFLLCHVQDGDRMDERMTEPVQA